ncbi:MAG TPA: MTAP family purine nucleoside phosphorylase [Symbiobacteriaceae bacterium]|nr:MTAP family purine nucleoside phosphorylase [Symbiobacteriaceae bacterium]
MSTLIIGGTAAYHLEFERFATVLDETLIDTPFGPAGPVLRFEYAGQAHAFLSRHGGQGRLGVTPSFINYRANVHAARVLKVNRILSWNSAGSLVRSLEPGSIAAVSDIIDWTRGRIQTFGEHSVIRQGESGHLFDPLLRQALVRAAAAAGHRAAPGAVYAGTEGARLETAAEIRLLAQAGAEIVGMTMAPEVFLAAELGLPYGSVCWISNYATGVPFDGPERRLFGSEVGPLMLSIMLKLLEEEKAA